MKKQKKQLYEGMYILSSTLSDEAQKRALNKITTGITERGGEVHKIFDQGRKKMAYEINKKREGHYFILYFTVPCMAVNEVWREYHLNEDLLRFITLKVDQVPEKIEFQPLPE
jgi:small subunit ribosomal protein S6